MSMIILFFTVLNVVKALQPNINGDQAVVGSDTNLRCLWSGSFNVLEWRRSPLSETNFVEAEILVVFTPPDNVAYRDENRFSFNKDDPENPLTIKNTSREDGVRYWCGLETSPNSERSFFDLNIIVPPDENKTSSTANGKPIKPGGMIPATVGSELSIVFSVFEISPGAKFEWMLDSLKLPETTVNTTQPDGLITSTSTATWTPSAGDNDKTLTCTASNGAPVVVTVSFTVQVEDPCDGVMCENGGGCVIDTNDPSKGVCNCTNKFEGEFCETAITTTVGPPSTPKPTGTTGTGLSVVIIIVIVLVCLALLVILLVVCVAAWKCHKKAHVSPETYQNKNGKNIKANGKAAGTADV